MNWPPLPASLFSHLGSVTVKVDTEGLDEGDLGVWLPESRTIIIRPGMHDAATWSILFHELVHLALCDAGTQLPEKMEEAVCNALGSYFAAAMLDGFVRVG